MKKIVSIAGMTVLMAGVAQAAPVSWGAATTIAGDTDVSASGTLEWAYSLGSTGDVTLNGQLFTGETTVGGNADVTLSIPNTHATAFTKGTTGPFFDLSSDYQSVLKSGHYNDRADTAYTVLLNNLVKDQEYEVQLWAHDARAYDGRNLTVDGVVTLDYSSTDLVTGGVGQFTIGTFTADATGEQLINVASSTGQLNAIQLRAIPEPATLGLIGAFGGGVLFIRRRFMI